MLPEDISIQPEDFHPGAFEVVIDITTGSHSVAELKSATATSYQALTMDPPAYVASDAPTLIVCNRGVSSEAATKHLRSLGHRNVWSLAGGIEALERIAGTSDRYVRQTRLEGFGSGGQDRLASATIAVVGAGGLGCPALSVLAPAGVGTIRIIDFDTVDVTNLHRQPLFTMKDIGRPKVEVAAERLSQLNDDVTIEAVNTKLDLTRAMGLLGGVDVVIDATDTFAAREAIAAATVATGTAMVYGSIFGFEGQLAVFTPPDGPCYRCVFPTSPDAGAAIDCATVGTLGAVTSVIGSLQAAAAIQLAAGVEADLGGILTMYDARSSLFERLPILRDPDCPMCGTR